jgi:hypothetical protein
MSTFFSVFNRKVLMCLANSDMAGKIEKNEMGEACDAYGGGGRCAQGSGGET